MTKVLFLPEVVDQFLELAEVLYHKGYLGFKKDAPSYFKRYGNGLFYSSFVKNKHTTWYVFYSIHEQEGQTVFLVRYLGNNHIIAHHLVEELD